MPPIDALWRIQGRWHGGTLKRSDSAQERGTVHFRSRAAHPVKPANVPAVTAKAPTTRRSRGSILRSYSTGHILDAFKLTFFMLVGAQAIFLSNGVVADSLAEVMQHQVGLSNLAALIFFYSTGRDGDRLAFARFDFLVLLLARCI